MSENGVIWGWWGGVMASLSKLVGGKNQHLEILTFFALSLFDIYVIDVHHTKFSCLYIAANIKSACITSYNGLIPFKMVILGVFADIPSKNADVSKIVT